MPIQDNINDLNTLIQNEFTGVTPANKISADDVKNLAQKTVAIASEAGAKFIQNDTTDATQTTQLIENQAVDTAQTAKDAEHDAEIVALKVVKKEATNVFFVDRRYITQAELVAQDATAVQGSMKKPFATPFGAKKAAIAWLLANTSKQAIVEIAKGNIYTIADYVPSEHAVTVSMGGIEYVSGAELAFHGITYYFEGSAIETPLMNAAFLAGQAVNGLSVKKAVFCGSKVTNLGFNEHANANIYLFVSDISNAHGSSWNNSVSGAVGVRTVVTHNLNSNLVVGNKWGGKGDSKIYEFLKYDIGRMCVNTANPLLYFTTCHNKSVFVRVESVEAMGRSLLSFGHWSGMSADGTLGGVENSNVSVVIKSIEKTDYIYSMDVSGGLIHIPNNRNSQFNVSLPSFETTIPKLMWVSGIQEGNRYHFAGKSLEINNPTSTELPFSLALNTSVLILENFDIESNVNASLFTITSGELILRNCKIKQTAAGQPLFNVATGATVVLENCHLLHSDRLTPLSTGTGKIVSKNSTSNVAIGAAVLRGDLAVSKWYDETLEQSELTYTGLALEAVGAGVLIPNPENLRIIFKNLGVLTTSANATYETANGNVMAENRPNEVYVFAEQANFVEYALIESNYILGE